MYYVLCIMYYVLCIMYYVLCIMYYVIVCFNLNETCMGIIRRLGFSQLLSPFTRNWSILP